jgi:hypothetical protein
MPVKFLAATIILALISVGCTKPNPKPLQFAKASGLFELQSELISNSETSRLRLTVKSKENLSLAHLHWHLPDGVTILAGLPSQTLNELKAGEAQVFEIEVAKLESKAIQAEIYMYKNQIKFGAIGNFAKKRPSSKIRAFSSAVRGIFQ